MSKLSCLFGFEIDQFIHSHFLNQLSFKILNHFNFLHKNTKITKKNVSITLPFILISKNSLSARKSKFGINTLQKEILVILVFATKSLNYLLIIFNFIADLMQNFFKKAVISISISS